MENIPAISHSIDRASEVSDISRSRLYEYMKSGQLAYSELDGKRLIMDEDLRALVASRRIVISPQAA